MGGRERRHHATPRALRRWLAVMIAEGGGFCDAVFFAHAHRAIDGRRRQGAARRGRACRRVRAVEGAPPGDDRAGARLRRGDARRVAVRGARPAGAVWDGPVAYPVAVGVAAAGHGIALAPALARLSACRDREPDLGRRAARFRSARPTASACSRRSSRSSPQPPRARLRPRSTRSAARRFAPISPACGTRRSTRGCSGHDLACRPCFFSRSPRSQLCMSRGGSACAGRPRTSAIWCALVIGRTGQTRMPDPVQCLAAAAAIALRRSRCARARGSRSRSLPPRFLATTAGASSPWSSPAAASPHTFRLGAGASRRNRSPPWTEAGTRRSAFFSRSRFAPAAGEALGGWA